MPADFSEGTKNVSVITVLNCTTQKDSLLSAADCYIASSVSQ